MLCLISRMFVCIGAARVNPTQADLEFFFAPLDLNIKKTLPTSKDEKKKKKETHCPPPSSQKERPVWPWTVRLHRPPALLRH